MCTTAAAPGFVSFFTAVLHSSAGHYCGDRQPESGSLGFLHTPAPPFSVSKYASGSFRFTPTPVSIGIIDRKFHRPVCSSTAFSPTVVLTGRILFTGPGFSVTRTQSLSSPGCVNFKRSWLAGRFVRTCLRRMTSPVTYHHEKYRFNPVIQAAPVRVCSSLSGQSHSAYMFQRRRAHRPSVIPAVQTVIQEYH